ncbi:MAG TPA: hypothetical protein VFG59_05630 [Anaeromyxobacter sp.]|nr:hypothetical protein [Anaeromyxobacter sp.]
MRPRPLDALAGLLLLAACARADRIEIDPPSVRFLGTAKTTQIRANPYEANGKPIPDPPCRWSSTDERVVKVVGRGNDAAVTALGPGSAAVRCTIGSARGELEVQVRVVTRIAVRPERVELKVTDVRTPLALSVDAFDDGGALVAGHPPNVTCLSEDVCRGDARGQVWPVGPGETTARVEVEGAAATVEVKVLEGRSDDARPKLVKGNPMEEIERKVRERERAEQRQKKRPGSP